MNPFRPRGGPRGRGRGWPRGGLFGNRDARGEDTTADQSKPTNDDSSDTESETESFYPSIWDVFKVRYLLQWKLREGFPVELVDEIIDAAEYWPSVEHHMVEEDKCRIVRNDRDQVLLKTVPLCYDRKDLEESSAKTLPHRVARPCRKIVFRLSSHDQGGQNSFNDDMYHATWTWFDIEVIHGAHKRNMYANGKEQEILDNERGQVLQSFGPDDELLLPRNNKVQVNGKHIRKLQKNTVVWHYLDDIKPESDEAYEIERTKGRGRATLDGRYVRDLEIGDSIALWARARFPGWTNFIYKASVRVFWVV